MLNPLRRCLNRPGADGHWNFVVHHLLFSNSELRVVCHLQWIHTTVQQEKPQRHRLDCKIFQVCRPVRGLQHQLLAHRNCILWWQEQVLMSTIQSHLVCTHLCSRLEGTFCQCID